jgi:hypothetical protein
MPLEEAIANRVEGETASIEGRVAWLEDPNPGSQTLRCVLIDDDQLVRVNVDVPALAMPGGGPGIHAWTRVIGVWRRVEPSPPNLDPWSLRVAEPSAVPVSWNDWVSEQVAPTCWLEPWGASVTWSWVRERFGTAAILSRIGWFDRRPPRGDAAVDVPPDRSSKRWAKI